MDGGSEPTAITHDEMMILNSIDYGQDEPRMNYEKYEALIPSLIKRGLVTRHTVWRLTEPGRDAIKKWDG